MDNDCIFIHPDNATRLREELALSVAVIARPDWFMQETRVRQMVIETERGVHVRCCLAEHEGNRFLIVYGRFDRVRTQACGIDFELTQAAISLLGISTIVGTFSVGSIFDEDTAGGIFVPHDFVGLGGHRASLNTANGFRNVDMMHPFCGEVRTNLSNAATSMEFEVATEAVYACFHGYPRIETEAELNFYRQMGWRIGGQTIDPEATLAREAGCHYGAIAATIDDRELRACFLSKDPTARDAIDENIKVGRRRTFDLFLSALPSLVCLTGKSCNCAEQASHVRKRSNFYYRPDYLCD